MASLFRGRGRKPPAGGVIVRRAMGRAIDHRRGAIIPAVIVVVIFTMFAPALFAPALFGAGRSGESPKGEHRGDYEPYRELADRWRFDLVSMIQVMATSSDERRVTVAERDR